MTEAPSSAAGNRRGKSGRAGPYHDHVGGQVPTPFDLRGLHLLRSERAECSRAQPSSRFLNKRSAR